MEGIIYKFLNNTNNKVYIGQTINEKNRYRDHKYCYSESLFHRAVKKYGFENFTYEVLEVLDVSELDKRERYWISYYQSNDLEKVYNLTEGGDGSKGMKRSDETRKKMSESHKMKSSNWKGHHPSEESKKKMSESHKGKHHSDETRKKMSESHKGIMNPTCKGKTWTLLNGKRTWI